MKNDHEATVKCRWGFGGAASLPVSSKRRLGGGSGVQDLENVDLEVKQVA